MFLKIQANFNIQFLKERFTVYNFMLQNLSFNHSFKLIK